MKMLIRALCFLMGGVFGVSEHARANLVELQLSDDHSARTLPSYLHEGQRFVAATPGHEFTVLVSNRSAERVLAVLSVDGVNAISGATAAVDQAGYILQPYQTIRVSGWRKSLQETAKFYFTEPSDSYAARTGRSENVGVIGIAVFREAPRPYSFQPPQVLGQASPSARDQAPASKESSAASARADSLASAPLGTGHGRRSQDPATESNFVRISSIPDQVLELRYDRYENLVALGIIPADPYRYRYRYQAPRAFPGFVPDP